MRYGKAVQNDLASRSVEVILRYCRDLSFLLPRDRVVAISNRELVNLHLPWQDHLRGKCLTSGDAVIKKIFGISPDQKFSYAASQVVDVSGVEASAAAVRSYG